jgi:hypothetical protein
VGRARRDVGRVNGFFTKARFGDKGETHDFGKTTLVITSSSSSPCYLFVARSTSSMGEVAIRNVISPTTPITTRARASRSDACASESADSAALADRVRLVA